MLETLTTLFQPWADFYAASAVLPTATIALHLLAILAGGGIAIGADRQLLRAVPDGPAALLTIAEELRSTHRVVIGALVFIVLSGLALATADLGTFATSRVFWMKMAAIVGLLVNGTIMRRAEARVLTAASAARAETEAGPAAHPAMMGPWATLRRTAVISLVGWFVIMLLGAVVANV